MKAEVSRRPLPSALATATLPARRTPAAVLVPLVERAGGMTVLLTQRANTLKDHAGQISFPGGRIEAEDADAWAAALREAYEEIGLLPGLVEFAGYEDLYRMAGGFLEIAHAWRDTGDVLYVDEAGVAKLTKGSPFFTIAGGRQPFASNGVIVLGEPPPNCSLIAATEGFLPWRS